MGAQAGWLFRDVMSDLYEIDRRKRPNGSDASGPPTSSTPRSTGSFVARESCGLQFRIGVVARVEQNPA